MRISPINIYKNTNNLSFGKYRDANAKRVVEKTIESARDSYPDCLLDYYKDLIENSDYFEAYTSSNGVVKGRIDHSIAEKSPSIPWHLEYLEEYKVMNDLSDRPSTLTIARQIEDMDELIAGKICEEKTGEEYDEDDYNREMAIRARDEARANNYYF